MKQKIILIKLGGSVITHKNKESSLNQPVLQRLVAEIVRAASIRSDVRFIIGHGHGSFGHVPAHQYRTKEGFIDEKSPFGMAKVLESVAQLHQIVISEFIKRDIAAVPFRLNSSLVTRDTKPDNFSSEVLEEYLKQSVLPVTCGDVMVDHSRGCSLWSTEEVLNFLALKLQERDWQIESIIHVTDVLGVLDDKGKLLPHLTKKEADGVGSAIGSANGFDVSGGMRLKVDQSLLMAESNITSYIISGLVSDTLYNLLTGGAWSGTMISA